VKLNMTYNPTWVPQQYNIDHYPENGILYDGDTFNGVTDSDPNHRGAFYPIYLMEHPEWPALTVAGNNVTIQNLRLQGYTNNTSAICLSGNNCTIRNVYLENFPIGIDMPTINANYPDYHDYRIQCGNTIEHVTMKNVGVGTLLRVADNSGSKAYTGLNMHDVRVGLKYSAQPNDMRIGFAISEKCFLFLSNIDANTWFSHSLDNMPCGMYIGGTIAFSNIKYTTELLDSNDVPYGYGVIKGTDSSVRGNPVWHFVEGNFVHDVYSYAPADCSGITNVHGF
jgi:hypothetical protein